MVSEEEHFPESISTLPPHPPGIKEVETIMCDLLRQVAGETLGQYLYAQPSILGPTIAYACVGELNYQRKREASIMSVFGRVSYQRRVQCRLLMRKRAGTPRSGAWLNPGQGERWVG